MIGNSQCDNSSQRPAKIARTVASEQGTESELDRRDPVNEAESDVVIAADSVSKPMNSKQQRYLLAVEYIGTRFCGSQKQLNGRTVVGALEDAFNKFIGHPVPVTLSSRTDSGVHALSNAFHVDVERVSKRKPGEKLPPHEPEVVRRAVNHFLQKNEGDVMVIDVRCVPCDFHARYMAKERTYFYRMLCGSEPVTTFEKDRAWHVSENLNVDAMKDACKILEGNHDFSSFRASGCQAKSPIRTLDELSVSEFPSLPFPRLNETQENAEKTLFGVKRKHRCIVVSARARSFLYHQVRLLVGVLKAVGTGELTLSDVSRILKAKNVTEASPMAPSCGLYLGHVKYDFP